MWSSSAAVPPPIASFLLTSLEDADQIIERVEWKPTILPTTEQPDESEEPQEQAS